MGMPEFLATTLRDDVPVFLGLPGWLILGYVFVIGAVLGSFLNVCVHRIPEHATLWGQLRSLWDRPSHCPRCCTNICWYDNIPILGWFKLQGRCRSCGLKISPRYPLVECLNGVLLTLLFWFEVPLGTGAVLSDSSLHSSLGPQAVTGLGGWSPEVYFIGRFLFHVILVEALLVASLIDLDLRIIPEATTTPATVVGVLGFLICPALFIVPVWFQQGGLAATIEIVSPGWLHALVVAGQGSSPQLVQSMAVPGWIVEYPLLHGVSVSLLGMIIGGGVVWLVRWAGFLFLREEAMGDGDVYLMAMVGAFLGWQPTLIAFFIAPVCALTVVALMLPFSRSRSIPYGPYLSLGTLLTLLFWQPLWERLGKIFELGALLLPLGLLMAVLFSATLGLIYFIKRSLGWLPEPLPLGEWRPAHQNIFIAGEKVARHTCLWKTTDWEGTAAGRGTVHEERWRGGNFQGSNGSGGPSGLQKWSR